MQLYNFLKYRNFHTNQERMQKWRLISLDEILSFNSFSSLEASRRASKYVIIICLHLLVLYQKSQSLNILTADLCINTIWTDISWSILYKIIWSFYFSTSLLPVRTKQIMATLCLFTIQYVHIWLSCCLLLTWKHYSEFLRKGCSHILTFFKPEIWTKIVLTTWVPSCY